MKKNDENTIYYNLCFSGCGFPVVTEVIKIDSGLHVQLECRNSRYDCRNAHHREKCETDKLIHAAPFSNFLRKLERKADNLITVMNYKSQHQHSKGQPPYSCEMIRFVLAFNYAGTSAQAFILNSSHKFRLPSLLLSKLKCGKLDVIKSNTKK